MFSDKQSFESFDSLRMAQQDRRKSRDKKSRSLFTGSKAGMRGVKAINVGFGGSMHESSNESLPLISAKRMGTPRV